MMISMIRAGRIASLAALALSVTAAPLSAAQPAGTPPETQTYLITTTIVEAAGPLVANELLSVDAGGALSAPASDPAAVCYNTAQNILAAGARPKSAPELAVSFSGNPVAIPLRLTSADLRDGLHSIALSGSVEGTFEQLPATDIAIVVEGNVISRDHALIGARFVEMSVLTASRAALGETMCTLARVAKAPPSVTI